jgi:hypothetical protein
VKLTSPPRVNLQTPQPARCALAREQSSCAGLLLDGIRVLRSVRRWFGSLASGVPAGLPAELLERRPDVIAAQNRVGAAFSRAKEAQRALPHSPLRWRSIITSELFIAGDGGPSGRWRRVIARYSPKGALKGQWRPVRPNRAGAVYQRRWEAFGDAENALAAGA